MSRNKARVYFFAVGVVFLLALLTYLRVRANATEAARSTRVVPTVQTSAPTRGSIARTLTFTGDILPIQQATIFPKVGGNLEQEFVDIGDYVQAGQLLALVDTTIYSQNARQARAAFMQAEATLTNAKITYERNKSLLDQNLIAKQDLDNSETAYKVAMAQDEAAGANYRNAATQLSYCRVTAPFGGFITRRYLDPGAYVTASSNVQGTTLFMLAEIQRVKIDVNILEKDVPLLGRIKNAEVKVDAYPNQTFSGRITRISQQLDLATRTMPIEVDLDNYQHLLKPGMFANVNLVMEKQNNILLLPTQVIMNDDSGSYVYRLSKDYTTHKTYIKIGISQDNMNEIVSGVTDSDQIVFMGQDLVKDGMKVRISR